MWNFLRKLCSRSVIYSAAMKGERTKRLVSCFLFIFLPFINIFTTCQCILSMEAQGSHVIRLKERTALNISRT